MANIVLASKSPRRQELLKFIFDDFLVDASNIDEDKIKCEDNRELPMLLAKAKGEDVFLRRSDDLIISADTIVLLDNVVFGKPKDREDARRMLKELSNKEHSVITGCYIKTKDKEKLFSVTTKVKFIELSDKDIEYYLNTDEPYDKAGAYGIQGKGFFLVEKVDGEYNNVVGLPISRLHRELEGFNI